MKQVTRKQRKLDSIEARVTNLAETLQHTVDEIKKITESTEKAKDTLTQMEEIDAENKQINIKNTEERKKRMLKEKEKRRTDKTNTGKVLEKVQVMQAKNHATLIAEAKDFLGDYTAELE
jgi:hypothetical protein